MKEECLGDPLHAEKETYDAVNRELHVWPSPTCIDLRAGGIAESSGALTQTLILDFPSPQMQ